jgi:AraC-like DNA-binding protein
MLLTLSILGIFLSVILVYFNARKFTTSIYLGIFFFLISLYGFIQNSILYSKSVFLVALVFIDIGFLSYLTGPMLYWYFRSTLTDNSRLNKNDLWHLLPMLIFLFATLPHMLTPWTYKMEIATKIVEDSNFLGYFNDVLLYQIFPKVAVFISRPLLILGYAFWSAVLFFNYVKHKRVSSVFADQKYMIKWLTVLLGFIFISALSQLMLLTKVFSLRETHMFFTFNVLNVLSGVGLAGLLISPFFFPGILYGLPRPPEPEEAPGNTDELNEPLQEGTKKMSSKFEADYLEFISKQTEKCIIEYQPYLQQDLNLTQLSMLVKIPVHHLAYYFREVKKKTFSDYRNEWRVEHAKNLIREGKSNDLTLEAIGILSGFSSRNTFLNAFKKTEGISPQAFLQKVKKKVNKSAKVAPIL